MKTRNRNVSQNVFQNGTHNGIKSRVETGIQTKSPLEPLLSNQPQRSFSAALHGCAQAVGRGLRLEWAGPAVVQRARKKGTRPTEAQQSARLWGRTLARWWKKVCARYSVTTVRRLRLAETISLGEKRFVAIVAVEGKEFLIGGGAAGMSLLAELKKSPTKVGPTPAAVRKRPTARVQSGKKEVARVESGKIAADADVSGLAGLGGAG
ncbi:MAG: flagellar biosynthetic protein FliO [Acidobacteriaceae bacterium]